MKICNIRLVIYKTFDLTLSFHGPNNDSLYNPISYAKMLIYQSANRSRSRTAPGSNGSLNYAWNTASNELKFPTMHKGSNILTGNA
jgi:hypothetical protein